MSLCLCLIRIVAEFFGTEFFGTIFRYEISMFWPFSGKNFGMSLCLCLIRIVTEFVLRHFTIVSYLASWTIFGVDEILADLGQNYLGQFFDMSSICFALFLMGILK